MASQPDIVMVASGQVPIYGGSVPAMPLWRDSALVNKTLLIPGSSGAGGAAMGPWGSYATDLATNRIYAAANGGHGDSSDNRVTMLDLSVDSPSWVKICAESDIGSRPIDVSYYPDGKPTSRHGYDYAHFVPQIGKVVLGGGRGIWGNGNDSFTIDSYDPANGEGGWDPQGTYPSPFGNGWGCAVDHIHGKILFAATDFKLFDPVTKTFGSTITGNGVMARYPVAYDTLRNRFFSLQWERGEAESTNPTLMASYIPSAGPAQVTVTFNASAAYTQFIAEKMYNGLSVGYTGMCYDSANDKFYWYSGHTGREGNIYVITPNNGTTWDMSLFSFASGSVTLPTAINAGVNGRLKYLPLLKGFIVCPTGAGDIYFIRTS